MTYRFGGTYPAWVTTAVNAAFQTYYEDPDTNNSRSPTLSYSSSGTALVTYKSDAESPCSDVGNFDWLACATGGGNPGFDVYLRNLAGAPNGNWGWYENDSSCSGDSPCFYAKRSLLHELGHAVFTFDHDTQSEAETIMRANQPAASATGWSQREWKPCDQAAAQLLWEAKSKAGPIAGCMDHVTGAGSNGLRTTVTLAANDTILNPYCTVTLSGALEIAVNTNYGRLTGDQLGSRSVTITRNGAAWRTVTTHSTLGTFSTTDIRTTAGSYTYVAAFANEGVEALTGDTSPSVGVSWSGLPSC